MTHHLDEGSVGQLAVIGPAAPRTPPCCRSGQSAAEFMQQSRLADAGLADDIDDFDALAGFGQTRCQDLQFARTANEGRQPAALRFPRRSGIESGSHGTAASFEPDVDVAWFQHAPRLDRFGVALEHDEAQIAILEQSPGQPTRGLIDDHIARLSCQLQTPCKMRGLADSYAFRGPASGGFSSDDDGPGGDPDADLQRCVSPVMRASHRS